MSASNSITFSQDGSTIAAGANKIIRLFQTAVPGKSCRTHRTHSKKDSGQPGATTFTAGLLAKTHCIRRRSCCAAVPVPCDTLLAVRPCERLAGFGAGIISCLAFSPGSEGLLAAGAYSGVVALYDGRALAPAAVMSGGHTTGITQAGVAGQKFLPTA